MWVRARCPFEVVAQAEQVPRTQRNMIRTLTVKPIVTGPFQVGGDQSSREDVPRLGSRTHTL